MISTPNRLIATMIPAPGTADIMQKLSLTEPHSMRHKLPIVWERAIGHSVYDILGNKFIDFTSGIFVANVGHANPHVLQAVKEMHFLHSYLYATRLRARYLERLTDRKSVV